MEKVLNMIKGFLSGMVALLMGFIPLTILWQVLTANTVFGMDVIANLTSLITGIGEGGFVGLVVLILITSFFVDNKK